MYQSQPVPLNTPREPTRDPTGLGLEGNDYHLHYDHRSRSHFVERGGKVLGMIDRGHLTRYATQHLGMREALDSLKQHDGLYVE